MSLSSIFVKTVKPILGTPFFTIRRVNIDDFPVKSCPPVMNIDHFWMDKPIFPPHPHAEIKSEDPPDNFNQQGFIAATLLLEDSEGSISNRDSLVGSTVTYLEPGGVYWCNSGSGLVHEQIPATSGQMLRGLQVFIDLPAEHKFSKAAVQLISPSDVPKSVTTEGVTVRTLVGVDSPIVSLVDIIILELTIPKGASFSFSPPPNYSSALIHMISGEVLIGGTFLGPFDTASFAISSSKSVKITNIAENDEQYNAKLIIFAGYPLLQPAVWGGPFLMLSEAQIKDRKRAFQEGEMGFLSPSLVSWPTKK